MVWLLGISFKTGEVIPTKHRHYDVNLVNYYSRLKYQISTDGLWNWKDKSPFCKC